MRTAAWKGFLEGCRRYGYECVLLVQPCPKEVLQDPADGYRPVGGSISGVQRVVHEEDAVANVAQSEEYNAELDRKDKQPRSTQ